MDKYEYIKKLSKLIAINGKVNLDKLGKLIDLNENFYNTKDNG